MTLSRLLWAALIIVCCSLPSAAAELELPRPKAAATSKESVPANAARPGATVHNFGADDKTCVSWTDGCVNCTRGDNDQNHCSNIGPVCQPKAIRCVSRK